MTTFSPKKGCLVKISGCETCDVSIGEPVIASVGETHRQLISLNYAQCFVTKNLDNNKANKLPAVPQYNIGNETHDFKGN